MIPASLLLVALAARPIVVLDPGHGGVESGCKSTSGATEKAVVLAIARVARRRLEQGGVRVMMTRSSDRNVELARRAELANRRRARVFVSIHANYAPVSERRGAETYVLSAHASDEVAMALLHQEEASAEEEDAFGGGAGDLEFILEDLGRSRAHEDSARLAKQIQDRLARVGGLRPSRGLRQAPFKVLKKAEMAAVLVEVGYLSNAVQAAYLTSKAGQRRAGSAIAKGILDFLRRRP